MTLITVPDPQNMFVGIPEIEVPEQGNKSVWSGRTQVVGIPGAETWSVEVEIGEIATEQEERPWRAFFHALRGTQNEFSVPVACQSHYGPAPVVASGATNGYSCPLSGMVPSTLILKAGQYMTVHLPSGYERLVCLTVDLRTDANGNATAYFEPALNEVPTAGAAVETARPFFIARQDTNVTGMSYSNGVSTKRFRVVEAL